MLLEWQKTYGIGHAALDAEHERLIRIINRIYEAEVSNSTNVAPGLLNMLYLTSMEHFRNENALMRDIIAGAYLPHDGCEKISEATVNEHCAEHARSLIELESILNSYSSDQSPKLADRLRNWFLDHAEHHDAHLRKFFSPGKRASRDRASI